MGQRIRRGSIGVWNYICPRLGGIGYASCLVSTPMGALGPLPQGGSAAKLGGGAWKQTLRVPMWRFESSKGVFPAPFMGLGLVRE